MCGIAGSLGARDQSGLLERPLAVLRHRGPNAQGTFARNSTIIGQNRLSVIDVEGGDPPITNEDGSVGVVLNGEIYNFRELRHGLRARGHEFSTGCDTEVIAHLCEDQDPVELASSLDGMFAFAVWDDRRRRLTIGRDRLGKKPLYYWTDGAQLVFASEIKGLLEHPAVPRRLDAAVIPAYLEFGYVPTPRTFFEGITSLPPGHVLIAEPGAAPLVERYWTPPVGPSGNPADASPTEVRRLLRDAVQRRLISDVPLGAFLSGGLDSSAIVALMSELSDESVPTFTIGFAEARFDERKYARLVSTRFRTDHHEYVVEPDKVELVERLVWHHDQPFGDSSAIPTYLLSEVTKRHVTVALSGDGGDELFAGYERFAAARAVGGLGRAPDPLRRVVAHAATKFPSRLAPGRAGRIRRLLTVADREPHEALRTWAGFVGDDEREMLIGQSAGDWSDEAYTEIWEASEGAALLDRLLNLNLQTYLPDDLLVKTDRMSMAHGLEVRSPFLDIELLQLATRLPVQAKARGLSLKRILREAFADLPTEVLHRRKQGFGVPVDSWFRSELRDYVRDRLGPDGRIREHLDGAGVDTLLAEHDAGREQHGQVLWTLLTFEVFLRAQDW